MKALILKQALSLMPFFPLFSQADSAFWTVTSRYQIQQAVETYTFDSSEDLYTYSATRTISSGITPTATPVSTSIYADNVVETTILFYTPGAVAESDLEPISFATGSTRTYYEFLMPIVYTAPATCSSNFAYTTTSDIYIPSGVKDQLRPTSIETGKPDFLYGATYVTETWYLTEGATPHETSADYIYENYIESCVTPDSFHYGDGSKYDDDDDDDYYDDAEDDDDDEYRGGYTYRTRRYCYAFCTPYKTLIIIIATILPTLFVLGFLESWLWFRRLMIGRSALRMGTISWVCMSLWVLCITRKQGARGTEDQKVLQEKWRNTPAGTKFKLWLKWGFRHTYPSEILGKFTPATTENDSEGGSATAAGPAPMQQQYGQVAPPPPVYMAQPGVASDPPQYYDVTKDGVSVTTQQVPPTSQEAWAQSGQPQQGPLPGHPSTTPTLPGPPNAP